LRQIRPSDAEGPGGLICWADLPYFQHFRRLAKGAVFFKVFLLRHISAGIGAFSDTEKTH
jgi:hypothetical protein